MKKIIGAIIGLIVGFILYGLLYQIIGELLGGDESKNFHLFFSSYPLIKPGLWIYSYFIASIIAGYIAGEKGKIVGIITISPIFILTIIALLQSIRTETIEDVVGGYTPIIFLVLGLIFAGMYGGDLGESWKTYKLDKFKAQSDLAAFLLVNFLIIILLFHIRFLNFLLTLFIAAIIAWFLSTLIMTFPPIYNRFNINKFKSEYVSSNKEKVKENNKMINFPIYAKNALETLVVNGDGNLSNDDLKMFNEEPRKAEKYIARMGEIYGNIFKGFFHCAAKGLAFVPEKRIIKRYGNSLERNYPEASNEFLKFAKTYWTLKIILNDLTESGGLECLGGRLLAKLEGDIGPVFFPFPGIIISPLTREKSQRQLIEISGANINIEKFIEGNPILIKDKMSIRDTEKRMYPKTLFKPKWFNLLPSNLRPDKKRISELEKLRRTFYLPHEVLATGIMSSPETTRKVQRQMLTKFRNLNSEAPKKELLKMVLISRITSPPSIDMTEQEMDQAMENINSFDDLCDYIIALDELDEKEKGSSFPDISGIGEKIDKILAQEEIEKEAPEEE